MITLVIGNSESKLDNLPTEHYRALKHELSYETDPQLQFYSRFSAPKRISLLSKDGTFPTGLLYIVFDYLKKTNTKHVVNDIRLKPSELPQNQQFCFGVSYPPYPEQIAAVEAASAIERGIITAPTGVGKSMIAALLIFGFQVRTLIVVPSLELKRQLTEFLQKIFSKEDVGKNKSIYVQNIDSVSSKPLQTKYDMLIIDEFHHSGAKTYRMRNKKAWNGIYYRFGLTATPFRSQDREKILLESVLSSVIYQIPYSLAVQKNYICPMEVYYISVPNTEAANQKFKTYQQAYKTLIVNNSVRNQYIKGAIQSTGDKKTLTLVKEIAHGELFSKETKLPFANGESEETPVLIKDFNSGGLNSLIGTMGVLGEGIDTKPCEFVILTSPMKSKNQFMQCVGRAFRRSPGKECAKVIMFKDSSHKWFASAFTQQCKFLKEEYNLEPIEIFLDR